MRRSTTRYLTTTEAGELVGVRPNTVEKACKAGTLVPDAVIEYIEKHRLYQEGS